MPLGGVRTKAGVALGLLALLAAGCGAAAPPAEEGKLSVVATVSPITNLVENVGGEHIELVGLVPEGVNSHTFEPSPSDARLLERADLVFISGLNLEEPVRRLALARLKEGARLVELGAEAISRQEWIFDSAFPAADEQPNPHLWINPPYALRYAEIIARELETAHPENSFAFRQNLKGLAEKILELDRAARAGTESIGPETRKLLTYHDSFPYFAREYGWTVIGAIQPSDFGEPSAREVARLIDQIRREKVPAIFGSEVFPSPVLEQIARATGARYVDDLRDDDLPGDAGDTDHSYVGLMKFTLITLVEAMGGNASALALIDPSNVVLGNASYRR